MKQTKPRFLRSAEWLNATSERNLGGWRPVKPVRWLLTDVNLARPEGYDQCHQHFPCAVQCRIDVLDALRFGRAALGELIGYVAEDEHAMSLLDLADRHFGTVQPDDGASLGAIVSVDAIYHDSWVAIPWNWQCQREAVLGDETWEPIVRAFSVDDVIAGRTRLVGIESATSQRVARYETAHHAIWRVGTESFHCERWKHPPNGGLDGTRRTSGWTENVRPYELPEIEGVRIDPARVAGKALDIDKPKVRGEIHAEVVGGGGRIAS